MIDLIPNADDQQIIDSIVDVLGRETPVERFRESNAPKRRPDAALWPTFAELGWFGLGLSETDGGVGYSVAEESMLFREAGRFLVSPAFLSSVLGARVAALSGEKALAERILTGAAHVALANGIDSVRLGAVSDGVFQRFDCGQGSLVLAWSAAGAALFDAAAFDDVASIPCLDDNVGLERATLRGARARAWLASDKDAVHLRADLLIAAQMAGMACAVRDMAVAYAKLREQFDQPIGAFQAIKHACADMAIRCEAAEAQVSFATMAMRDGRADTTFQIAAARMVAGETAMTNATRNIQVHGGMGFTADCDANHFLKRANLLGQIGGNLRSSRMRLLAEPAAA